MGEDTASLCVGLSVSLSPSFPSVPPYLSACAGHADFSFEVKRSLCASDGCVLLVDASQGPQAQTFSHLQKAIDRGLPIIAALNKAGPYAIAPGLFRPLFLVGLLCNAAPVLRD